MEYKLVSLKTVVAIVIGAALYFVLFRFASIETPVENTYINFGIAILAALSAIFGPIAGFLIGFIGHALTDFSWVLIDPSYVLTDITGNEKTSWNLVISSGIFGNTESSEASKIWWSWVIASGVFGCVIGWFWKSYKIDEGGFGLKECLTFNAVQIITNVLVWVFLARTLDMMIYNEAFDRVSLQSFAAAGFNSATVLVLGSLLAFAYSKFKASR
jgi:energy-coupling factor transport system substrate-specific component